MDHMCVHAYYDNGAHKTMMDMVRIAGGTRTPLLASAPLRLCASPFLRRSVVRSLSTSCYHP